MGRLARRTLMVAIGVTLLAFYVSVAFLGYRLLAALLADGTDLATTVVLTGLLTVLFGYLSYRYGTRQLLASLDAVVLPRERAPTVHARLDRLCERMDVERPTLLVGQMGAPNALALGGAGDGVVVVDRNLLRLLDIDEFEAIVAHELAHLERHDSLVQTLAYSALRTVMGAVLVVVLPVVWLATGVERSVALIRGRPERLDDGVGWAYVRVAQAVTLLLVVLTVLVRAHSRRREYAADDRAAAVTGNPLALARALRKLEYAVRPGWGLLSPFYTRGDEEGTLTKLLSTHPSTDERVERLVAKAREREQPGWRKIEVG